MVLKPMQLSLANILVDVDGIDDSRFFGDYLVPSPAPVADFSLALTPELVQAEREVASQSYFSDTYLTQLALLRQLAEKGPAVGRFLMHAAVLEYDGRAYAFTTSSGTGKSTHLLLWHRTLGNAVQAVNGDKPLLYASDAEVMAAAPRGLVRRAGSATSAFHLAVSVSSRAARRTSAGASSRQTSLSVRLGSSTFPRMLPPQFSRWSFLMCCCGAFRSTSFPGTMEPIAVRASFEAMTGQDFDACLVNNGERNSHED